MEFHHFVWIGVGVLLVVAGWYGYRLWWRKGLRWIPLYLFTPARRRRIADDEEIHVLLCVTDHYEPKAYGAPREQGRRRVERWVREYPRQFERFRDSDGRTPRHCFFFPIEEYEPEYLDALAELCRAGFGEVEVHLHHNNDTADNLRSSLSAFRDLLAERHGLLCRDKTGALRYGFIHGNWGLCNSRPRRDWCGVNNELDILRETGCYADFTYPSAPDGTQPPIINRIYYAADRPGRRRSHWRGWNIGSAHVPEKSLLLIQGPLLLDWGRRKYGLIPRVENACLQASQPPSLRRLDNCLRARIHVPGRPDWLFVKLHAHGAPEYMHEVLLGEPMVRFHQDLAERAASRPRFHYHYVSAREMYNLAKAAEAGFRGTVAEALDYLLVSNIATATAARPAPETASSSK